MRQSEARWIADRLAEQPVERLSPFLNVGSQTAEYRERKQPHIDRWIFAPLRERGVEIIHADLKSAPGVDIAGDITAPEVQQLVRARRPRAALSSNLLEHLRDPDTFARVLTSLVEPGGLVLVTVPRSYPYHADPIDTGFRPTPDQLAALFVGARLQRGEVVEDCTYAQELRRGGLRKTARSLVGALRPRGEVGRAQRDKLRWLFRPFTTSCVLLEAPS
jgi:hypothetical protein